ETKCERELPRLECAEADCRVHEFLEDSLRRVFGDLLDLDAAFGADHEHGTLGRAVDHETEIQLALDLESPFDEHALDLLALRSGLVGDQVHPDHLLRRGLRVIGSCHDLDAAALPASTGVNLRLDDNGAAAEP